MIHTQEATGKTVDEARAKACALLGVQAEDLNVSYEVLEMPQKTGFLGLKLTPAKVRVSVEEPDVPAAPIVEEAPAPAAEEKVEAPAEEAAAPAPAEDAPCCMYHQKGFASLTGGLRAADKAQNAETTATTVQMVSVLFSVAIAVLLTSARSIWQLPVTYVLMYQAAWSALSIAVCALKQHN